MPTALLARKTPPSKPQSRLFEIAHRIAARFEPRVARAFLDAVTKYRSQIDRAALIDAVAGRSPYVIEAAVHTGGNLATLLTDSGMEQALLNASRSMGFAAAEVLEGALGVSVQFNATHPNVILFARQQTAELVVAVAEEVREAIRIVIAVGQEHGLTIVQQARAIQEVVGLPPNWARAPSNLAQELREGRFTTARRLSAVDKKSIASRLAKGTVDEAFIAKMQTKYTAKLLERRALNIARTETLRATGHGQRESWKQAVQQGVLPTTARRTWIVTLDDRLRDEHAAVPGMNPGGVPLDGYFNTPLGRVIGPPLATNCRCGEGLVFPGESGVL